MFNNSNSDLPTTETFLKTIIDREACGKHRAHRGTACWTIIQSDGFGKSAVCNQRAKKAGFRHKINEKSLRLSRPKRK